MGLSAFIEEHLDEIVDEWRVFAQSISPEAEAMSRLALEDHARAMLLAIAADMKTAQTAKQRANKAQGRIPVLLSTPETAAVTHGVLRHLSGFNIDQLVSEFRALRASVLTLWRESDAVRSAKTEVVVEEIARFNEGIDQALTESIQSYSAKVDSSRDMFLAVLGHDVRGPLSGISMATLLLESPGLAEPVRLQIALRVRRAVGVIGRLTTDLLEYARSRLGPGIPVERSDCDLREICEEAIDALKAAHPGQAVITVYSGDLNARFDVVRLHQALGNLLNNAVQHGDTSRPISVSARRESKELVFAITNHGQPIPEDAFARIFEPLVRLPPERDESFEQRSRVGLGLFIVKQIIESHGGMVSVESLGELTAFMIRLPDDQKFLQANEVG